MRNNGVCLSLRFDAEHRVDIAFERPSGVFSYLVSNCSSHQSLLEVRTVQRASLHGCNKDVRTVKALFIFCVFSLRQLPLSSMFFLTFLSTFPPRV